MQKHAECIMEVKTGLESFETRDMKKLIQFHETIEARLEQLTDESQVRNMNLVLHMFCFRILACSLTSTTSIPIASDIHMLNSNRYGEFRMTF